jgi:Mannosyltransferase putative
MASYLDSSQRTFAIKGVAATRNNPADNHGLTIQNVRPVMEHYIRNIPAYSGGFEGRGIVICGGGVKYFTPAWVCIRMLRHLGCRLPIQLWHTGKREMSETMAALVAPFGVECVDATAQVSNWHLPNLKGWPLKPFAMLHSPFRDVLLLDADNVPLVDPEFLFDTPEYRQYGAILWPDAPGLEMDPALLERCGVPLAHERSIESGQIVIDKERCWRELNLALWCNKHADFFYQFMHGDKETYGLAFRKLGRRYAMPEAPMQFLDNTMCQHDFSGRRILQHRNMDKWCLLPTNRPVAGFEREAECFGWLQELRDQWDGRIGEIRIWKDPSWRGRPVPPAQSEPVIMAAMISCRERDAMRAETLQRLRHTDWGARPVHVEMDEGQGADRVARIAHVARAALSRLADLDPDYALLLEDDLDFSRSLLSNLLSWAPLQHDEVTLASLYNPGIPPLAIDTKHGYMVVDPQSIYGCQAFLLARPALRFILEHWEEGPAAPDFKIADLGGRCGRPVLYHAPALVQHVGRCSVWGGTWHEAADFDPAWRRS